MDNPYDQFVAPEKNPYDQFTGGATPPTPMEALGSTLKKTAKEMYLSVPQAAASLASGTGATIASGLTGIATGGNRELMDKVQQGLTYQPDTTIGKGIVTAASLPGQALSYVGGKAGDAVTEGASRLGLPPEAAAALGTQVDTGINMAPLAVTRGAGEMKPITGSISPKAIVANKMGYSLTPEEMGAGPIAKMLSSFGGEPRLAKGLSLKNQPITNSMIARDLGLSGDTSLSPDLIKAVRTKAGESFEKARGMGRVNTDVQFFDDLTQIIKDRTKAEVDFPTKGDKAPVHDLISSLRVNSADADAIVSKINTLRKDADKAFAARDNELGFVNKEAAKALEEQLIRHAEKTGQDPKIVQDMIDARSKIAKTYAAQKALDSKGNINPMSYVNDLRRDKPLNGEGRAVAKIAGEYPRSNQPTSNIGSTGPSWSDLLLAVAGPEGLGLKSALLGARPLTRTILKSDIGQSAMINTPAVLEAIRKGQASPATSLAEIAAGKQK